MSNVLCIDTSNQPMSVAVYKDNQLAVELTVNIKRNHSIQLMPAVRDLMKQAELKPNELTEIVVGEGPGSFTGIRIGMTTAKSLAWTLNIPIKTVSSLELVAGSMLYQKGFVCPFFDARRGNVFTGLYETNYGDIDCLEEDGHTDMESWLSHLKELEQPITFVSPNGDDFHSMINSYLRDQAIILDQAMSLPRASLLYPISQTKEESPVHLVKPNYQRMTQAEANWIKQHKDESTNE
ncbi:tRNA (adenosine(37)-N6)-threonylcarbamoyltransferase complex dimerization subunit type 1 TsaB [Aquisalibacillus elongatus]|uniref:tRNA threonylcarbamoyladenosine biosynthesis protein TsaB n=1 Tax=Aquisalibacillus elongatus TaxID=485577 RepID=A0A3N5C484_9BACI|nr:tRNA (adenosine(37)-N6)-threonylcarbamoyltransferase complex dimerization subunit type 1 TsaB [Aquisalibacillus elongatus]RPF57048.1 tRNA threonylcarbamoyladenosine biosynthesis protein TsaB [Aquisalibacillus elongatus]